MPEDADQPRRERVRIGTGSGMLSRTGAAVVVVAGLGETRGKLLDGGRDDEDSSSWMVEGCFFWTTQTKKSQHETKKEVDK